MEWPSCSTLQQEANCWMPRCTGWTGGKTCKLLKDHPKKSDNNGLVILFPSVLRLSKANAVAAALQTITAYSMPAKRAPADTVTHLWHRRFPQAAWRVNLPGAGGSLLWQDIPGVQLATTRLDPAGAVAMNAMAAGSSCVHISLVPEVWAWAKLVPGVATIHGRYNYILRWWILTN